MDALKGISECGVITQVSPEKKLSCVLVFFLSHSVMQQP